MVPPAITARLKTTVDHAIHENNRCRPAVDSVMSQGYRQGWMTLPPDCPNDPRMALPNAGYDWPMKRLLLLAAVAAVGVIVYKVLTSEIPLEDS